MPHNVYANNNEIASKSADGTSSAAGPDVCFTTPPAVAGGTPIPFTNTCSAKDISNGSKTVLIKNKEIALEDKSFFKKSTGDEAATQAFKKGIISGKITGKGYFISWSPNVKVEGLCVTRHMDTVTHNHSNPPNALVQKYRSVFATSPDCARNKRKIEDKCKPKPPPKEGPKAQKRSLLKTLGNIASFPDDMARKAYGYNTPNASNRWVNDHCDGLWVKPSSSSPHFREAQEKINEVLEIAQDPAKIIEHAMGEVWEMAKENLSTWFLVKQGLKLGGRALVKNLVGGAAATTGIGLVVTAAMAASTVNDVINTALTIAEKLGPEALQHVDDLLNIDQVQAKAAEIAESYKQDPMKAMADMQTGLARVNPCVQARRCQLVPYSKTDSAPQAARSGDGCCPGQTGHHILPETMMKDKSCYEGHGSAPTMCLEGANNTHGSHGAAHGKLFDAMSDYRIQSGQDTLSYEQAKDKALDAVTEPRPLAPASGCNRKCLEQQLDAYYEKCKGEQLPAVAGSNKDGSLPSIGGGGSM